MTRHETSKHTVTKTRLIQAEAQRAFPEFDGEVFYLNELYAGAKYYDLFWMGRFTAQFKSRKAVHEWVINQIDLRNKLLNVG